MSVAEFKWRKVQSKTHSGHYYYFNSKTGESTWSKPPDFKDVDCTSRDDTSSVPVEDSSNVVYYNSNVVTMELGVPNLVHEEPQEMDVAERWAEDEELMMDVDMTTELQEEVYQQVVGTRNNMTTSQTVPTLSTTAAVCTETIDYSDFLYLVIDTNILLSHLQFLVELKDCAIKGVGKPVLVIPWMVMQELDFLKTATSSVATKAHKAIQFLHACFSGEHPRVRGQTMKEVNTEVANLAIHNNDDKILHCCLVYQSFVTASGGIVVLFSNDTQLCSKAIVNGIKAFNSKTLLSELRLLCRQFAQQRGTIVSYTHTQEYAHKVEQQMRIESSKALLDDLTCEAESVLREGLSAVVQEEMSKAFGNDLWLQVVAIKPPWTFKDIVQLLDKHWIAVFGMVVGRNLKDSVTNLSQYLKKKNSMTSLAQQAATLIEQGYKLLQAFSINDKYGGVVVHSMAAINVLNDKLKETCREASQSSASTGPAHVELSAEEQLKQLATSPPASLVEQVPWVLGVVYESVKLLGSTLISTLQTAPNQEALAYLSQLHSMLSTIITNIQGLISSCPNPSINTIHNTITSLSLFLNVVLSVNNPVQPDALITYCHSSNILILQKAMTEFDSLLTLLQPYR